MHYLCSNENSSTSVVEWALAKVSIRSSNATLERKGAEETAFAMGL